MIKEKQSAISKMWWILIALLVGQIGATAKGCSKYCNNNIKCTNICDAAILQNRSYSYADYAIGTRFIGKIDTEMEITGSDSPGKRGSRISYFTTRDGKIFYVSPNVDDELSLQVQPELKLIWEMPASMELDSSNDKGLYSIAFSKSGDGIIPAYVLYAKKRGKGDQVDHHLCIATLMFNRAAQSFSFVKQLFSLPQISNFRSGGFLTMGRPDYSMGKIPLWFSSGGNEFDDADMMQRYPRYSAISSVWTDEVIPYQDLVEYFVGSEEASYLWANGIYNPLQCDYSILRSREIPCLVEIKDISGKTEAYMVTVYEKGHSPNENTASVYRSWGTTSLIKEHAEQYFFYPESTCLPETIYYNTAMGMGSSYMNKLMIAQPSCDTHRFPPVKISAFQRNYLTEEREFMPVDVALEEPYMYDVELIGSELNRGIYLAGRSLRTGDYEIYMLYDRSYELTAAKKKKK